MSTPFWLSKQVAEMLAKVVLMLKIHNVHGYIRIHLQWRAKAYYCGMIVCDRADGGPTILVVV